MILQAARRYGVDPEVALRDAMGEGGIKLGAVGDHGTSFGPFQLHVGGALPSGKDAAWANSQAGIDYALRQMAQVVGNKTGLAGVSAAVRGFERPADPAKEIARDMGYASIGAVGRAVPAGGVPPAPHLGAAQQPGMAGGVASGVDFKRAFASYLLQASANTAMGGMPDFSGLIQLAQMRQQAPPVMPGALGHRKAPAGGHPTDTTSPPGKVTWLGAPLAGEKTGFTSAVDRAAAAAGATKINVISGYRSPQHNAAVGGVPRSNHTTGDAMDGSAFVPGRGWVPLGALLKSSAGKYGLRSGDVPGFYRGGTDPNHVDDGANQR